jgi:hypothetical protein
MSSWGGAVAPSGSVSTGNLQQSTSYGISCTNISGTAVDYKSVTVNPEVPPPPPPPPPPPAQSSIDIKANGSNGPIFIASGLSANLSWTSVNMTSCTASGDWSGNKNPNGNENTGILLSTRTYTLTCTGPAGTRSDSVTIYISAVNAPTVNLTANPTTVNYNSASTLSWSSSDATSCSLTDFGAVPLNEPGRSTGPLTASKTYSLFCSGPGGVGGDWADVTVLPDPGSIPPLPPPDTLSVVLTGPSSGIAPATIDLTALVGGTLSDTINYTFYCNRADAGINITPGYAAKFDGVASESMTANSVCTYSSAGTYTAKVIVERGGLQAEARLSVRINNPACTAGCVSDECTRFCGGGIRTNYCTNADCSTYTTTSACNTQNCCGAWTVWAHDAGYSDGSGGTCSVPCGGGLQSRSRDCIDPYSGIGYVETETRTCNAFPCVDFSIRKSGDVTVQIIRGLGDVDTNIVLLTIQPLHGYNETITLDVVNPEMIPGATYHFRRPSTGVDASSITLNASQYNEGAEFWITVPDTVSIPEGQYNVVVRGVGFQPQWGVNITRTINVIFHLDIKDPDYIEF